MTLLIGSWTIGLILAILALGVFVSFRIFAFPDITADGSLTLGAAVVGALITRGYSPWSATAVAMLAGALAGATTGVLHTKFQINGLLAGILVSTALYSVNLHVMGRSNIPLLDARTIAERPGGNRDESLRHGRDRANPGTRSPVSRRGQPGGDRRSWSR